MILNLKPKKIEELKQKLNIDPTKPTLYLGKLGEGKGVNKIIEHLDDTKYNLVATGKQQVNSDKYKTVFLSKREYPMLLKISDVVLSMSIMPEGWNRIAHEAMLVKTPVIGSGSGGMKELLESAGQKVVTDFSKLETEIHEVLNNKKDLGILAFNFVKQFDLDYFKSEWTSVIK